jgi:iron complex outermembrane receptor protein
VHSSTVQTTQQKDSSQRALELPHLYIHKVHSQEKHNRHEKLHELHTKDIDKNMGNTLADVVKALPGLEIRSMGPSPARPVYRGLGGDRLSIQEDGAETKDISGTSPDHAVTIDPLSISKVEVIKGPKVLLSTPTTLGAIVNVHRHDIPFENPGALSWSLGAYGQTAKLSNTTSMGGGVSGEVVHPLHVSSNKPEKEWIVRGEASFRKQPGLKIPNQKELVENTQLQNINYSVGSMYSFSPTLKLGGSYRQYDSEYGIPPSDSSSLGHPNGADVELKRKTLRGELKWNPSFSFKKQMFHFFKHVSFRYNRTYFHQLEFESNDKVGAEFVTRHHTGDLLFSGSSRKPSSRSWEFGFQVDYKSLEQGSLVFTPNTQSFSLATMGYHDWDFTEQFKNWRLESAFRYEYKDYSPTATLESLEEFAIPKSFHSLSTSWSLHHQPIPDYNWSIEVSRSNRAPTEEELYSAGPHFAAFSYERGNPNLQLEDGLGFEWGQSYETKGWWHKKHEINLSSSLFYNHFFNYIFHENSGEIDLNKGLPIYNTNNDPARFVGGEVSLETNTLPNIWFDVQASYVHGSFANGRALPQIPPFKTSGTLSYKTHHLDAGSTLEWASKQNRVGEFETPTNGYTLLHFFTQYSFYWHWNHRVSLKVNNILDTPHRNHLSRLKTILPEAGRTFHITYKMFI